MKGGIAHFTKSQVYSRGILPLYFDGTIYFQDDCIVNYLPPNLEINPLGVLSR